MDTVSVRQPTQLNRPLQCINHTRVSELHLNLVLRIAKYR